MYIATILTLLLALPMAILAFPSPRVGQDHLEVLRMRASTRINPTAVTDTVCDDPDANIVFHDQNVAELAICGGISGSITKCAGAPTLTTGSSGSAKFTLSALNSGATINLTKGRWEACVRAAAAVCPTGTFSSVCIGGASSGDVAFTLDEREESIFMIQD
ncbi:hypothetical protein BP5796_05974 [Coleophoma crateriformis]|uniref:Ecp2 effector protein domain-containing protein n=1 Tax=Coleophoma crateriformis TaxID=565419 RepID=A0A3D8RVM6_9HELO|nr:hypothetical protein BP5796_05974 [Coleophoma crateriformis]